MAQSHDDSTDQGRSRGLTRQELAQKLGLSRSSIRRLEDDLLFPELDERGVWRFDPAQVEAVRDRIPIHARGPRTGPPEAREAARAGRVAAKVFRLFARHRTLPEIVVITKQPPERVRVLYHEWVTSLEEGEWSRE